MSLSYVRFIPDIPNDVFLIPFAYTSSQELIVTVKGKPVPFEVPNPGFLHLLSPAQAGEVIEIRCKTRTETLEKEYKPGGLSLVVVINSCLLGWFIRRVL